MKRLEDTSAIITGADYRQAGDRGYPAIGVMRVTLQEAAPQKLQRTVFNSHAARLGFAAAVVRAIATSPHVGGARDLEVNRMRLGVARAINTTRELPQ